MTLARFWANGSALVVALCLLQHVRAAERESDKSDAADSQSSPAASLVRQALEAEADGDGERRAAYLQDALAADADYAPAHWHSGEVRVGDRWLSIDAAAAATARAGKMAQYRRLRDQAAGTAEEQLKLARWCAGAGLKDQERLHLTNTIHLQLTKKQQTEVMAKLGLARHRGVLMSRAQIESVKHQTNQAEGAMREWKPRLTALRRDAETQDAAHRAAALEDLRSIRDPSAIPELERTFVKGNKDEGVAVVAALTAMQAQAATDSLIRHALFAKHEIVRKAAAEALKEKPLFGYAPTLMSALQTPVEVEFESYYVNGQFRHRLALFQEGPTADYLFSAEDGETGSVTYSRRREMVLSGNYRPDLTAAADAARAENELAANPLREQLNERVAATMRVATGNDFDSDPNKWWQWWYSYNEMYQPTEKTVVQTVRSYAPPPPTVRYVSCFVEGTPVWTSTGPMPIEQVRAGECLLAQDPESGELAYKPVMATTVRPASPLIEIHAGGETIQATRGHPFWVDSVGWQMAKELKAGQYLHTTHGPVQIESAEQKGEAQCYNLIVADFNTYFVSNAQVLVHDNNLRQVTSATVPGLVDR